MIAASAGVKVMVATKPVDFRKGADGLAALVREQLRHDRSGSERRNLRIRGHCETGQTRQAGRSVQRNWRNPTPQGASSL
jgi:hypothetical protein